MNETSKFVKPENTLKKKVGNGGFTEADLAKAQVAVEKNTIDFKPIASGFLDDLDRIVSEIRSGEIESKDSFGSVMFPLMQIRAQGSMFHYPSLTRISDIIVDFLDTVRVVDKEVLDILVAFKKSALAILALNIKDATNKVNNDLCNELKAACERYLKSKGEK